MTIEQIDEAIAYMAEMRSLCAYPDGEAAKAYDAALAALREARERAEGCHYCNDGDRFGVKKGEGGDYFCINEGRLESICDDGYYDKSVKINFCPMCGKEVKSHEDRVI